MPQYVLLSDNLTDNTAPPNTTLAMVLQTPWLAHADAARFAGFYTSENAGNQGEDSALRFDAVPATTGPWDVLFAFRAQAGSSGYVQTNFAPTSPPDSAHIRAANFIFDNTNIYTSRFRGNGFAPNYLGIATAPIQAGGAAVPNGTLVWVRCRCEPDVTGTAHTWRMRAWLTDPFAEPGTWQIPGNTVSPSNMASGHLALFQATGTSRGQWEYLSAGTAGDAAPYPAFPPDAPAVTVSAVGKRTAVLTGGAFSDPNPADVHAATEFRVRNTATGAVVSGPVVEVGAVHSREMTGLPFFTPGLVGEVRYQDSTGLWSDDWGTSAPFSTAGWDEGTEELVVYESDDVTVWADCSSSLDHARPFLMRPDSFGESQVDLLRGTASIAQETIGVLDRPLTEGDQGSGWFSAKLATAAGETALIGRRAVRRRWVEGDWLTVIDGVVGRVQLQDSRVVYRLEIRDTRERERKLRAFDRTGTATVFPRGVLNGYGRLPNGQWLVPPTVPVRGLFDRKSPQIGAMRVDGVDTRHPDANLVLTEKMAKAVTPEWDGTAQSLVLDKVTVLWRAEGSGGPWNELRRMPLPEQEMWTYKLSAELFNTSKPITATAAGIINTGAIKADLVGAKMVSYIRMVSYGGLIPADGQRIEVIIRYDGPASEDYPLHFDGTFGELWRNCYRGDYTTDAAGNPVDPRLRYDEDSLLALDVPCHARITKPTDNLKQWVEESICQPNGAAPAVVNGRITCVRYALPDTATPLTVIDRPHIFAASWQHGDSDAVNLVRVTYNRDYFLGAVGDPLAEISTGDGIATRKITVERQDEESYGLLSEKLLKVEADTLRSLGGKFGSLLTGDVMDEVPAQLARERGHQALDRFKFGGQHYSVDTDLDLQPGTSWVLVQVPHAPDYRTGRRALAADGVNVTERLAQVVSRRALSRVLFRYDLVDAGAVNQPALAPTLGAPTASAAGVVTQPVTVVPADTVAAVEFAVTDTSVAVAPAGTSSQWVAFARVAAPADVQTPPLPAGVRVWTRGRGVKAGERASLYTAPQHVDTPETPRLEDLGIHFDTDGTASLTFVPNAFAGAVHVAYDVHPEEQVADTTLNEVAGPAAAGVLVIPTPVPTGWVLTLDVTAHETWTGSAVSGDSGETHRIDAKRVLGPWIYSVELAFVGPNKLGVTVLLNDYVHFWSVWSANGSDPVVGGVPDPRCQRAKDLQPDQTFVSWAVRDGTHNVLVRASGKDGEFHEVTATLEVTGIGGGGETGVSAPTDVPSTPRVYAGDLEDPPETRVVYAEWVNTNDLPDIEVQFAVFADLQEVRAKAPGDTSDTTSLPANAVVKAHVRYTNGPGLEGPWSPWSPQVRLAELAPLPPPP